MATESTHPALQPPAAPFSPTVSGVESKAPPRGDRCRVATYVVTDSGLGGLSVAAELCARLQARSDGKRYRVVFFNACPALDHGYNTLADTAAKASMFDRALKKMQELYAPDRILVACNTLSVVAPETDTVRNAHARVQGIAETSIALMEDALRAHPNAKALLFGTPTTVSSDCYQRALTQRGIARDRIVDVACPDLMIAIEQDGRPDYVEGIIGAHLDEVLAGGAIGKDTPIFVSLNCTHYGYAEACFVEAARKRGLSLMGILNPNGTMAASSAPTDEVVGRSPTQVAVEVVGQVGITAEKAARLGSLIRAKAPALATALCHAKVVPGLFWQDGDR